MPAGHQSLKIGLYSVLRFTTMTQSPRELINYSGFPIELTPMVKTLSLSAINCWNKTQNMLGGQSLKSLYPTKIKTMLTNSCIKKYQ